MLLVAASLAAQSVNPAYQQAIDAIRRGDADAAVAVLTPGLRDQPDDLRARTLLGMAFSAAGKRAEATREFERALRLNPKYIPALRNLAANEMASADVVHAKTHFEQVLQLDPQDTLAHLALADIALAARHYKAAAEHFGRSGDLYLQDAGEIVKYARACTESKEFPKAATILERLPASAGGNEHYAAGLLLAQMENFRGAAREFELARPTYDNKYEVGYNLLLAYLKSKQPAAAAQTGRELISAGLGKAELYNVLAQAYEADGKTAEAYDALRTATKLEPADETNYLDLIGLCVTHKNYNLALEIADIGVGRMPKSARLQVQRGIVLAMKEDFGGAKGTFEKAQRLAPTTSTPSVALALILMQMNRVDEATKLMRERASGGHSDFLTLWFLAEALNRGGAAPGSADEKEAVAALEKSIALNPQVAQARILLGKFLARSGQTERAKAMVEEALRLDPDNVTAMYQLAQILSKTGEGAKAKELFAKVSRAKTDDREQFNKSGLQQILLEMKPDAAEARYQKGLEYQRQAKTEEAMQAFREAERLRPHYTEALYMMADSCRKLGDTTSELRLLRDVVEQAPNFVEARYNLGIALKVHGKLAEAIEQLRAAVRLEPANAKQKLALGIALAEQNSPEAVEILRSAASLEKESAAAHYNLALALANAGQEQPAIREFQTALKLNPRFSQAQRGLGIAYLHRGQLSMAISTLQEALRLTPGDAEAANSLATAQLRGGDQNAAIAAFEQAVRLNPRLIKAHSMLAQAYLKAGREQDSKREGELAAALTEEQRRLGRAMVLLQSADQRSRGGDLKTAEEQVREAIAENPNLADGYFQLGQVLGKEGDGDGAIRAFRKALDIDPERADAHFEIGAVLRDSGHAVEAQEEFQHALRMRPCEVEYLAAAGEVGTN
jgi:tetratricopeptide (TPR) repeat protein